MDSTLEGCGEISTSVPNEYNICQWQHRVNGEEVRQCLLDVASCVTDHDGFADTQTEDGLRNDTGVGAGDDHGHGRIWIGLKDFAELSNGWSRGVRSLGKDIVAASEEGLDLLRVGGGGGGRHLGPVF